MRSFAQKPKATQQTTSAKSKKLGRAHFGQHPQVNSILQFTAHKGKSSGTVAAAYERSRSRLDRFNVISRPCARFQSDIDLHPSAGKHADETDKTYCGRQIRTGGRSCRRADNEQAQFAATGRLPVWWRMSSVSDGTSR